MVSSRNAIAPGSRSSFPNHPLYRTASGAISVMDRAVIKFSSEDCGICHKMSFYDQKVVEELGLQFIDCKMQDTATYRKYRKILLTQYPDKSEMGWPTYIVCDAPETDNFKILGEVKGGHPKGEFRSRIQAVLAETN
ncbi:thioredoxin family protein [Leptodesmis sp.]|uniref:thioredoxin family protein n=1 Tax=Leptodesmis sp. TaxID=3100501 RepID=UPI0040535B5A